MSERPVIVCLCGSTRFKDEFQAANMRETLAGKIVLAPGLFGWSGDLKPADCQGGPVKEALDRLHCQKIDLADEVLVIDVGGYIGESTRNEINHAVLTGKRVRYLSQEAPGNA